LFIGNRRDTWQVGIGVSGEERGLALSGLAALQQVRNAEHVAGTTQTRIVGRIQATLGFRLRGVIRE
jgi:hypothetical protein